jgi:probable H4MPT-linked C1 transfer pathway protein
MADIVLGLDIGGANLKAATPDKRARSVPFPLWKQPDALPQALASLVAQFPDATELAVTMTGELCDCFETKREGVAAIIKAVRFASAGRRVRVWSTDGAFLDSEQAKANHLKVAAANWHALATFAGQYVPKGRAILVDIGSTTTDVIPIFDGKPIAEGKTDYDRLFNRELVYSGVRRTPVCALLPHVTAAELFATTLDAYLILGLIPENPDDRDTADGRPATKKYAHARLARMYCADSEMVSEENIVSFAEGIRDAQRNRISDSYNAAKRRLDDIPSTNVPEYARGIPKEQRADMLRFLAKREPVWLITSGAGEFLVRDWLARDSNVSIYDQLGPEVSACAPAYAVAVLAAEARA